MTTTSMISLPHVLFLWVLLIVFFVGAFVMLVVRQRKERRARRNGTQKKPARDSTENKSKEER